MIQAIEFKILGLFNWARSERGQTTAEYVAVTAVAVALAIGVLWVVLNPALNTALTSIADGITDFVSSTLP